MVCKRFKGSALRISTWKTPNSGRLELPSVSPGGFGAGSLGLVMWLALEWYRLPQHRQLLQDSWGLFARRLTAVGESRASVSEKGTWVMLHCVQRLVSIKQLSWASELTQLKIIYLSLHLYLIWICMYVSSMCLLSQNLSKGSPNDRIFFFFKHILGYFYWSFKFGNLWFKRYKLLSQSFRNNYAFLPWLISNPM